MRREFYVEVTKGIGTCETQKNIIEINGQETTEQSTEGEKQGLLPLWI